jgi:hypothetical protein
LNPDLIPDIQNSYHLRIKLIPKYRPSSMPFGDQTLGLRTFIYVPYSFWI